MDHGSVGLAGGALLLLAGRQGYCDLGLEGQNQFSGRPEQHAYGVTGEMRGEAAID